ncbi:glutamine-hydrolyzing GMP synthase [Deltaproteobacteria bacterium TL4]
MHGDFIAILDFGSQYAHLIAKRIRHLGVFTQIFPPSVEIQHLNTAKGIVFSGGPSSVFAPNVPAFNAEILNLEIPILGLCYGHQLIAQQFGGRIENTGKGEFGKTWIHTLDESPLWKDTPSRQQVWMSHQDSVTQCPSGFIRIAETAQCAIAAMQHQQRPLYTLQFHPEVKDSQYGNAILSNFVDLCHVEKGWSMETFVQGALEEIRTTVGNRHVLMFLSGGVDSSVAFALLNKALGVERVLGLFIDNGFLRKNEAQTIMKRYQQLNLTNVHAWDAEQDFLDAVQNLTDPQEKRRSVGATFIHIRDKALHELDLSADQWMLGQGTLYPDIIESGGTEHSEVIKSHHNRVQEVQDLIAQGHVVEPLKELYKDEVRQVGTVLGLPDEIVWRHPFPGPGLSINTLCSDGKKPFVITEKEKYKLEQCVANTEFSISLLPVRSVGVQGDQRTYTHPAALTGPHDWDRLETLSTLITNEVREVNRVVTLLTANPLDGFKPRVAFCTKQRLDLLREADHLATQMLVQNHLMREIFQLLVILLPISTSGQEDSIVLRPVCSEDVMTAQFAKIDWNILMPCVTQIQAIEGINAVFYDVTHKPPATFGWE